MIEVRIPNNIAEYKPKFLLGLTGKQFFCLALALALIILDFVFLRPYIGDLVIVVAVLPAFFAVCFAFGERFTPGNIPFEKYLQSVFTQTLMAPKCRRARSNGSFIVPCDKYYEEIPDSALSKDVLNCVQEVREKLGIVVEETPAKRYGQFRKAPQKAKYRKSKQAYL